jgi:TfoX/Sxy family transcriptional regulator of competence genes
MFGCLAYTVNNNMFAGAYQDSLFIRLSERDRQDLRARHSGTRAFEPMEGRVMKEYMLLPPDIYNDDETLHEWLSRSYEYALSLPPKQRKRRAAKRSGF